MTNIAQCPDCGEPTSRRGVRCPVHRLELKRARAKRNSRAWRQSPKGKLFVATNFPLWKAANPEAYRLSQLRYELTKRKLVRRKPRAVIVRPPLLAYPFVRTAAPSNVDLLAVCALVPYGATDRDDVCQEIMLAIFEGRITLAHLKANPRGVSAFFSRNRRANYEAGGFAISLSQPRYDGRPWDDVLGTADAFP